jgi:hypothetical protein
MAATDPPAGLPVPSRAFHRISGLPGRGTVPVCRRGLQKMTQAGGRSARKEFRDSQLPRTTCRDLSGSSRVLQPFGLTVTGMIDAGKCPRLGRLFKVPPSCFAGALRAWTRVVSAAPTAGMSSVRESGTSAYESRCGEVVDCRSDFGRAGIELQPAKGVVGPPWIAWGKYVCTDGVKPDKDGLNYGAANYEQQDRAPSAANRLLPLTICCARIARKTRR